MGATFSDLYKLTGETLGEGSYGRVETCKNVFTSIEYAVKIIEKRPVSFNRTKVLKEIEIYHLCRGQKNIIQLIEFFEETDYFYLVFEKINGGPLLNHIQKRVCFTEAEASQIIKDLAEAIRHLHRQGIAHRDLKPDNVLCMNANSPCPVKLCDCDLWSLGIIMYILLCGYAPFSGHCGLDCGWERGESCLECQEMLFSNIKKGEMVFPEQHWGKVSSQAKDLIKQLLVRDSSARLDAEQVLSHPWVANGGSFNPLQTPTFLKRQTSIKDLEDFASRAMAVNRAVEEEEDNSKKKKESPFAETSSNTQSFQLSPPSLSKYSLLQRRRRSKEMFSKFSSINEIESDVFMRAIC